MPNDQGRTSRGAQTETRAKPFEGKAWDAKDTDGRREER
jgi:hypothetical protein